LAVLEVEVPAVSLIWVAMALVFIELVFPLLNLSESNQKEETLEFLVEVKAKVQAT